MDDNKIQAFVLDVSEQLVLLQYVYDFNLDGVMILRISDISDFGCSMTDKFQERLMAEEGLLGHVPFGYSVDLSNWGTAIAGLRKEHSLLILERELLEEPDFAVGRVLGMDSEKVSLKYFTGAANWLEEPVVLKYNDITSCQAGTNYVKVYQRYFGRNTP